MEPATNQDVSTIVKLLANVYKNTKFAVSPLSIQLTLVHTHDNSLQVKGGGHSTAVGFSSTTGVLISMRRFDSVVYNKAAANVAIGAGNVWDNVYGKLDGTGVTVAGGRISGRSIMSLR